VALDVVVVALVAVASVEDPAATSTISVPYVSLSIFLILILPLSLL